MVSGELLRFGNVPVRGEGPCLFFFLLLVLVGCPNAVKFLDRFAKIVGVFGLRMRIFLDCSSGIVRRVSRRSSGTREANNAADGEDYCEECAALLHVANPNAGFLREGRSGGMGERLC